MIIAIILLILMAIAVFSPNDSNNLTDYELYGDIDPLIYGKCMASEDYKKGYFSAKSSINNENDVEEIINQARNSLTMDDFDRGWKDACKEYLNK